MKNMLNIAEGFKNIFANKNKKISDARMKICRSCSIFKNNYCSKKLGGCGCYLPAKTKVENQKCPIDIW